MAKEIKYGSEARAALERGVNQLADTVKAVSYTHLDVYKRQTLCCNSGKNLP